MKVSSAIIYTLALTLMACTSGKTDYENSTLEERSTRFEEVTGAVPPKGQPFTISGDFITSPYDYFSITDYEYYILSLDKYNNFYPELEHLLLGSTTFDAFSRVVFVAEVSDNSATCHFMVYDVNTHAVTDQLLVFLDTALDGQLVSATVADNRITLSKNVMGDGGQWIEIKEVYRFNKGKFIKLD